MKKNRFRIPLILLAIYLAIAWGLVFFGYRVEQPRISQEEFPFSVTYSYQGETETVTGVYVCRAVHGPKELGRSNLRWDGWIKEEAQGNRDFFRVAQGEDGSLSVDLNMDPGYLMGDPARADYGGSGAYAPRGHYSGFDGTRELDIQDPAELEKLGFRLVDWEYPQPIENSFQPGGIKLGGQASFFLALLSLALLLGCMIFVPREKDRRPTVLDRVSLVVSFPICLLFVPFVTVVASLSEIVPTTPLLDLLMVLLPGVSLLGVAASLVFRRVGCRLAGLLSQFAGPGLLILVLILDACRPA